MNLKFALPLLAVVFASFASAQTTHTGTSGSVVAPTAIGQSITANNIALTDGSVAHVDCPVTFFGSGTYQWNWQCGGGSILVNGQVVASNITGTMTYTCSGGGRYHVTTCYHQFAGQSASGPVSFTSRGAVNNATSSVTAFSAVW